MAITYIDPSAGSNGSGTFVSPKNTWVGLTLSGNNSFLQKSGTTYNGTLAPGGAGAGVNQEVILGVYESATGAAVPDGSLRASINATGNATAIQIDHNYTKLQSLEIYGSTQLGVYASTNSPIGVITEYCYIRDITGGDGQNAALYYFSPGGIARYNTILRAGGDGIFVQGASLSIHHNDIRQVSLDALFGDGIQVSNDFIDSSNPYIADNHIEHTSVDIKSSIFVNNSGGGSSTGGQILRNTCIGKANATTQGGIGFAYPNMTVIGNMVSEGWRGIDILSPASNALISGNIITQTSVVALIKGITNNGASGVTICNNIILNSTGTFSNDTKGIQSNGDVIRNNIIQGWKTGLSGSGFTEDHNDFFANQTNGSAGTGTITGNPLFVSSIDFHLQSGSPCIGAGVDPGVTVTTFDGVTMGAPFYIGAYWSQTQVRAWLRAH